MEKKYNKHIILEQVIDEEILGGIYVRVNNEVMDSTVKSKLDDMKDLMLNFERRQELEKKNILKGIVKTKTVLTEEELNRLVATFEKKYSKHIILEQIIDKEMIGGIYVNINNDVFDGTVETKLNKMRRSMFNRELR